MLAPVNQDFLPAPVQERSEIEELIAAGLADSTRRVYRDYLQIYWRWLESAGLSVDGLPPEHRALQLCRFLNWAHREGGWGKASIAKLVSAVRRSDPALKGQEVIDRVTAGIRRLDAAPPEQVKGLTAVDLAVIRATGADPATDALISLMRDGMMRSAEPVALLWEDLSPTDDGSGRVLVRRSKTDQEGAGATLYLSPSTMRRIDQYRRLYRRDRDPRVFPITTTSVRNRIRQVARAGSLNGRYSGHSPRVGMLQDLMVAGYSLTELQVAGRWKDARMPAHYGRNVLAGQGAVARWYQQRNDD